MSRRGFYKEGTQESIRETERFLQHREAITELDIHGEEIDIRTVTVTSEDKGGQIWPMLEAMVNTTPDGNRLITRFVQTDD